MDKLAAVSGEVKKGFKDLGKKSMIRMQDSRHDTY
jgi:hypothetical protein